MPKEIIFKVSNKRVQQPGRLQTISARQRNFVSGWLYFLALMAVFMVVIGGLTRLTESGLSMVEWHPFTGWLPPLSNADWMLIFELYKASPEYKEMNPGMSLLEFKDIFWLEYIHRLWGRLIGVFFLIPFVVFIKKRWIDLWLGIQLSGLLAIGGLQGLLGWYMVQSGLVDRPDVSQYRLAAHLGVALIIIAGLIWVARGFSNSFIVKWKNCNSDRVMKLRRRAVILLIVIFTTVCSGALVAGLNAGLVYNTFPLMQSEWLPEGLFAMAPMYLNFFENIITVQFDHRILALISLIIVVLFWFSSRKYKLFPIVLLAINCLLVLVVIQICLGVLTLLMIVPKLLALAHQTCGVMLFIVSVWVLRELSPPTSNKGMNCDL